VGSCGLTRKGALRVFSGLHQLPQQYERFRHLRHPEDERLFFFFDAIADESLMHTFTFLIDDTTSAEHLIVGDLELDSRKLKGQ
jgi:hypothetical protein